MSEGRKGRMQREEEQMGKRTLHKPKLKMREIKGREAREIDKKTDNLKRISKG